MKSMFKRMLVLSTVVALSLTAVHAQSDSGALIDALVKKGILTDQESENIRAQLSKDYATTPAGKFIIGGYIKQLELYGDGRVRFDYQRYAAETSAAAQNNKATVNDRERYRLRIGVNYTFSDNFSGGFELESATAANSGNQTMGAQFGKFPINIGKVFLKYKATDWLTLTAGKFSNPWYSTDLQFDPDIYPEGGAEQFSFIKGDTFTLGLTAMQLIYVNNTDSANPLTTGTASATGANEHTNDVFIYAAQVPVTYNFTKTINAKIAPGVQVYSGGSTIGTLDPSNTINQTNTASTISGGNGNGGDNYASAQGGNDLLLLSAPGEVNFKAFGQPIKTYWDVVYNVEGRDRVQNVYLNSNDDGATAAKHATGNLVRNQNQALADPLAALGGVQIGQNKKKGDWSIKADYRIVGLGSIDPNVADSDFANGYDLNSEGVRIQGSYNISDNVTFGATFFDTDEYKKNLQTENTGVSSGFSIAGSNKTAGQRLFVDLGWKF